MKTLLIYFKSFLLSDQMSFDLQNFKDLKLININVKVRQNGRNIILFENIIIKLEIITTTHESKNQRNIILQ